MSQNGQTQNGQTQMLQDFKSVFDHFGTLYIKGLKILYVSDFQFFGGKHEVKLLAVTGLCLHDLMKCLLLMSNSTLFRGNIECLLLVNR